MTRISARARCLTSAIAIVLAPAGLHAATLTVDSSDDDPLSTACNLRNALKAVNDGSTMSAPTCIAAVSGDPFGINDTIAFATNPAISTITLTQGALSVTASSVTINGTSQTIDAAGSSPVLAIADGATLAANSLYLTGGNSSTTSGGVSVGVGATARFTGCSISGNVTTSDGGALYAASSSTLELVGSTISGNSARAGGGLFATGSTVTVTNSLIAYNVASSRGGGIYAASGSLALDTAQINGNSAQLYSGGVVIVGNSLTATNSIVFRNSGGRAGGMFLSTATGTITTSTILGNTANCGFFCAGAIYLKDSTFDVTDSTLNGNLASGRARYVTGGVGVLDSVVTFANSTISGNVGVGNEYASGAFWEAHFGGATELTLVNSTVSDNSAAAVYNTGAAGGVLLLSFFSPTPKDNTLRMWNTIVSANVPADRGIVFDLNASTITAAYNLLGSAQNISVFNDPGNHNVFSDAPGLGPLQGNGGPTATRALLPGSPALRAGSSVLATFASHPLNFDQRGISYVRNFSGTVDIGAFEDQGDRVFATGFELLP